MSAVRRPTTTFAGLTMSELTDWRMPISSATSPTSVPDPNEPKTVGIPVRSEPAHAVVRRTGARSIAAALAAAGRRRRHPGRRPLAEPARGRTHQRAMGERRLRHRRPFRRHERLHRSAARSVPERRDAMHHLGLGDVGRHGPLSQPPHHAHLESRRPDALRQRQHLFVPHGPARPPRGRARQRLDRNRRPAAEPLPMRQWVHLCVVFALPQHHHLRERQAGRQGNLALPRRGRRPPHRRLVRPGLPPGPDRRRAHLQSRARGRRKCATSRRTPRAASAAYTLVDESTNPPPLAATLREPPRRRSPSTRGAASPRSAAKRRAASCWPARRNWSPRG